MVKGITNHTQTHTPPYGHMLRHRQSANALAIKNYPYKFGGRWQLYKSFDYRHQLATLQTIRLWPFITSVIRRDCHTFRFIRSHLYFGLYIKPSITFVDVIFVT